MNNKYTKPLILILAILILCIVTTVSYAYYTASISGESAANVITTGNMEVTYENGSEVNATLNMIPGEYVTKTFSVTNTGNVYAMYDIYLNEVLNTFVNKDELVCELISENGVNITQRECPSANERFATNVGIDIGQTHNYTLKITFLIKNYNQDENKDATFSTKVELKEGRSLQKITYDYKGGYLEKKYHMLALNYGMSDPEMNERPYYGKANFDSYYYEISNFYAFRDEYSSHDSYESCMSESSYSNYYNNENPNNGIYFDYSKCIEVSAGYDKLVTPFYYYHYNDESGIYQLNYFETEEECKNTVEDIYDLGDVDQETYEEIMSDACAFINDRTYKVPVYDKLNYNNVCILENEHEYCLGAQQPWDNESSESQQTVDFVNSLLSTGDFACDNKSDNDYEIKCIGKTNNGTFTYRKDGNLLISGGRAEYEIISDPYDDKESCYSTKEGGQYCVFYDNKYYHSSYESTTYNNIDDCLSACGVNCQNGTSACYIRILRTGYTTVLKPDGYMYEDAL